RESDRQRTGRDIGNGNCLGVDRAECVQACLIVFLGPASRRVEGEVRTGRHNHHVTDLHAAREVHGSGRRVADISFGVTDDTDAARQGGSAAVQVDVVTCTAGSRTDTDGVAGVSTVGDVTIVVDGNIAGVQDVGEVATDV